jgi:hypothetical protein
MKILCLDIENTPNLADVWGLWEQNVSLSQLRESAYVMCWAAKWLGDDKVFFNSVHQSSKKRMLKEIHKLLDEADAVLHFNGKRHDIRHLNREFLEAGMLPPSPYRQIDLFETAKRKFNFPSNKLEYICSKLGVGRKLKHTGHELWTNCMAGDEAAWATMEEYNINDVLITEEVYYKFLPWIDGHANWSLFSEDQHVCTNCGSDKLIKRGKYHTVTGSIFQRFQCKNCGKWAHDNKRLNAKHYKMVGIPS